MRVSEVFTTGGYRFGGGGCACDYYDSYGYTGYGFYGSGDYRYYYGYYNGYNFGGYTYYGHDRRLGKL